MVLLYIFLKIWAPLKENELNSYWEKYGLHSAENTIYTHFSTLQSLHYPCEQYIFVLAIVPNYT